MKYLLDTHALVWALTESDKLSEGVRDILTDGHSIIVVSTLSFWEISLKFSLGKLSFDLLIPESFPNACQKAGFEIEEICSDLSSTYHGLTAKYHKDPFDRMLIWQSLRRKYTLITDDTDIKKYTSEGLKVIW